MGAVCQPQSKEEAELKRNPDASVTRLIALPKLPNPHESSLTPADGKHIEDLISRLAEIDGPDAGISPSMTGSTFAPVLGSERFSMGLLSPQDRKTSAALLELVQIGPKALPLLLKHLDDATPTKYGISVKGPFPSLMHGRELDVSEANPVEMEARKALRSEPPLLPGRPQTGPRLDAYQVRVGDVCFTIIGQIVSRGCLAVRYQPTAIIIINSPVDDPALARAVRAIWSTDAPRAKVMHSLLQGYCTRAEYDEIRSRGFHISTFIQSDAAIRMLYYFPSETAELVASRLNGLDVLEPAGSSIRDVTWAYAYDKRELANGLHTWFLIKAVAWCKEPQIASAVESIACRTTDLQVLTESVQAVISAHRSQQMPRILALLRSSHDPERAVDYNAESVMRKMAEWWGKDALPVFKEYIRTNDPVMINTACTAMKAGSTDWDRDLLLPLLADTRTIPHSLHSTLPNFNGPEILERVCDAAADALAGSNPKLEFDLYTAYANQNMQIAEIRAKLVPYNEGGPK